MGNCSSPQAKPSPAIAAPRDTTLYIIAVLFNPAGYSTRTKLYNEFRARLEGVKGVQLYTVEAAYEGREEWVTPSDSEHDIHVLAEDPLWLKENLINIAVRHLPPSWRYMAWVDADLEFPTEETWVSGARRELDREGVIQLWQECEMLGPEGEVLETAESFGYFAREGHTIDTGTFGKRYPHPGFAWGMTRAVFDKLGHGLPEWCVVGSGDNHFAYATIGRIDESVPVNERANVSMGYLFCMRALEREVGGLLKNKGPGYVKGVTLRHHWHGDWKDRGYVSRWRCLNYEGRLFDPKKDLSYTQEGVLVLGDDAGCYAAALTEYFSARKEDDMVVKTDHKNKHVGRADAVVPEVSDGAP